MYRVDGYDSVSRNKKPRYATLTARLYIKVNALLIVDGRCRKVIFSDV